MNDFDVIKNIYLNTKKENQYILNQCHKLIIIPQMYLNEIKRIVDDPQTNDEIQFDFVYLELAKTIYNDGKVLCIEEIVKPFETTAFEYLIRSIRLQINDMCDLVLNITSGNSDKIYLAEFETRDRLRKLARELVGNDINDYYRFLAQLCVISVFELNSVARKIIELEYDPDYKQLMQSELGIVKVKEYYRSSCLFIKEACLALFNKEANILDRNVFSENSLQRAILYLNQYKKYIKEIIRTREK